MTPLPVVPFGVYVHVPFCAHRCDYCDFATWTDRDHLVEAYVDACGAHAERERAAGAPPATSVFFGGGTPSRLAPAAVARILDAIPRARDAEVTIECNPDSVDRANLEGYGAAGVNRISLGVQSLVPSVLGSLGRTHDPANVARAVAAARAVGFDQLNLDVIFGAAGESVDDWTRTVEGILDLEPDHVSAYALTVVPSTPLGRRVALGVTAAPDDDDQAAKYEIADDAFAAAGLGWYEISNWSRPGSRCEHNLVYWGQGDYLAIGCAAHGHRAGERWWNVRTPEQYVDAIVAGASARAGSERLDPAVRAEEAFGLALRTAAGAVVAAPAAALVADLVAGGFVESLAEPDSASPAGSAPESRGGSPPESGGGSPPESGGGGGGNRIVLTRAGRLLADDITARLLLAGAAGPPSDVRLPPRLALGTIEC